jgi:hypothetical protein
LQEANKLLRFLKSNADVAIRIKQIAKNMKDLVFVVLTDAAWAVREDGSSQGGYVILLCHKRVMDNETADYIVFDWRSWKLPRVSRSSLASEAQAAAGGVDALEFAKCFWSLSLDDRRDPRADHTMQVLGTSALVIDAKALYDAARKEHVHNFEDKRTGIEVMVLKEKMKASGTIWKWVSSERQYADGLTKMSARQLWADRLRATTITLKHDPNFVAAKKKDAVSRRAAELVGSSKVYMIEEVVPSRWFDGLLLQDNRPLDYNSLGARGQTNERGPMKKRALTTLTVATQILKAYAQPVELEEETSNVKFTIMVMMLLFVLGFVAGCCCAYRCCRTAEAATRRTGRPSRAPSSSAAAAADVPIPEEPEPEQDLHAPLLPPTEPPATPMPPPPTPTEHRLYPQSIWVSQRGTQYHLARGCTGLAAAASASEKHACLACIGFVDGDGTRRRAR